MPSFQKSFYKHLLILLSALTFGGGSLHPAQEIQAEACTFKGFPLYGKVQYVDSFPDLKVQIVTSFPDLNVQRVDSFPDDCGEWQEVTSFPDIKVQVVDSFPDLKIQYVDSFPGIP